MQKSLPSHKTLAKSIAIFGGAQAFTVLAGLVRSKFAAELIGTSGVGLNAILVTVLMFMTQLMGLGLAGSGVKYLSEENDERPQRIARIRVWGVITALASIVVMLIIAPWLSQMYMDDWRHAWWFALLSIVIALQIVCQIELSILRSLQQTRRLAHTMIVSAIFSVIFSVPFFYWFGVDGVIWSVFSCYFVNALYVIVMGIRSAPIVRADYLGLGYAGNVGLSQTDNEDLAHASNVGLTTTFRTFLHHSRSLLTLGFAFLLTGIVWQGVELITQTVLSTMASVAMVGLYKSGYQIAVTYPGILFTAVANDFYPRLAQIGHDVEKRNQLVNQLIRVLVCIVVPCIIVLWLIVPYLVPILLSEEFLPMVGMARWAMMAVIVQCLYHPIAYLPLAMGKARDFSILEVVSLVQKSACILAGFFLGGLVGSGVGVFVSACLDLLVLGTFVTLRYKFRLRLW